MNIVKQYRNNKSTEISNNRVLCFIKSRCSNTSCRLGQYYTPEPLKQQFYIIQFYINQFYRKYKALKTKVPISIGIVLLIFLIISQFSAFAYIDIEGENLPPYAALDLFRRTAIDINFANDGTTGYSTSTLKSKINEILKPKLAQKGI